MRILDQVLKHERYFEALTGLRIKEFQRLVEEVKKDWKQTRIDRLMNRERKKRIGQGRKDAFPTCEEQLFIFLFWARTYPTYLFMEIILGSDTVILHRLIHRMAPLLAKRLMLPEHVGRRRIRNMDELKEAFPEVYEVIVDATEQRIERPKDKRKNKKYRSGKKKAHTLKTQIITDVKSGRILHVSDTVEGKRHDFKLFQDTVTPTAKDGGIKILADSGYQGIKKKFPGLSVATTFKRFRGVLKLTKKQKRHNRDLSKVRVRVEHALGKMKQFKVLAHVYRHAKNAYNTFFRATAGIINLRISMRAQVA
jgi:hypothetical protein